jgi:tRNA G18 (ribose-2'-O)-methylase SpoU
MIVLIDDADDPRIAAYRDVRERDLVGREGKFIAEGEVVLRTLVSSPLVRPVSLLIAAQRLERLAAITGALAADVPVYVAAQSVLDSIAGFHLHRGLLGLGERVDAPGAGKLVAGLPARSLVVALFGISNHDNMGGVFRNAAAFGADAVLIDATCCDPLYRKAIRVSVGAVLRTPFARLGPDDDAVDLLKGAGFEVLSLSPAGSTPLTGLTPPARAAILLGSEGQGLSVDILARTTSVAIPMANGFDSLNVATTSGIVLHHLAQGR